MKIALILRGQSRNQIYHRHFKRVLDIDYRKSWDNYLDYLVQDHDCDVFFHTFESELLDQDEMVSLLKPKEWVVTPTIYSNRVKKAAFKGEQIKFSVTKAIEQYLDHVRETGERYDLVIVTRFDLEFVRKIDFGKLDPNKLYLTHFKDGQGLVGDDNLIIGGHRVIREYYRTVKMIKKCGNLHNVYGTLRDVEFECLVDLFGIDDFFKFVRNVA